MTSPGFPTLRLLAVLCLASPVRSQTNHFFPENGQGFLSAGCKNWIIRGAESDFALEAECPDQVCGNYVYTALSMNECLMNDNGNLYWNDTGYYSGTCGDCYVEGDRYLYCPCRPDFKSDPGREKIGMVNLNTGIIVNYYGYLSCFGKVDFDRGRHNWPCKGDKWTPWGSSTQDSIDLGVGAKVSVAVPVPVTARPERTLVPQARFLVPDAGPQGRFFGTSPNTTAGANGSVVTVTVTPTG